jgi:AraC-like DNA-binding protein
VKIAVFVVDLWRIIGYHGNRNQEVVFMALQPQMFDPRQEMGKLDFELQYKRDSYLKDVELHHHDFFELYFLLSGDVTYIIESKIYHVMPGDILLINPQELHQICIRPEMSAYERYVLWIDPKLLTQYSTELTDLTKNLDPGRTGHSNLLRTKPEQASLLQRLFDQLCEESSQSSYGSDLLQQALLLQLLVTINRLVDKDAPRTEEQTHSSKAVSEVVDYVNLHYSEPLSLEQLAEQVYVSKYHLSHEFNRLVGTSVYRYIQKKRLLIARQLLAQGKRPNEVYNSCGFGDYAGFYRAFRNEYGISPREYAQSVRISVEQAGNV